VATYAAPSAATVRAYTGLNGTMFGLSTGDLDTEIGSRLTDGEDDVFLRIGENYRTDTLSAAQVRALQRAVAHRTAALMLFAVLTQRTTGTHAPHLMEDPEEIQELMQANEREAGKQESLLKGAATKADIRPRSKLAAAASTFSVGSTDRTPSERSELLDERDDRSAWDTAP
jgi:hypothetical protein